MNGTTIYLMENLTDITFGMTLLENMGCSYIQTEEIVTSGNANNVSPEDVQKIINFKHALEFLQENAGYPVELGTLMDYNAIIGYNDDTHPNPGYIRTDREVRISRCSYVAPPVSSQEALEIVI